MLSKFQKKLPLILLYLSFAWFVFICKIIDSSLASLCLVALYRQKQNTCNPITIEELTSYKIGDVFDGNVIVTYKAMLDETNKSTEIMRSDLTDSKGEMTVTLNVRGSFIQQYEQKLLPGKAVRIKNFKIAPKTNYDHGESDCILVVDHHTTIENITSICQEYYFVPNTTIRRLILSTESYTLGTIGAIVTSAKKLGMQHVLEIKDGNSENDKATVSIFLPMHVVHKILVFFIYLLKNNNNMYLVIM